MEKVFFFKSSLIIGLFIIYILMMNVSTGELQNSTYTKEITENSIQKSAAYNDLENIAQFLASASEINREEIQLGQLAQQKGNTEDVKELGKEMEAQHLMILQELSRLADRRTVTISSNISYYAKNNYQKLTYISPEDFDKEYCDWLIKNQQESIALFVEVSNDTSDMEINIWAKGLLPILRKQLAFAETCQKKFEKV